METKRRDDMNSRTYTNPTSHYLMYRMEREKNTQKQTKKFSYSLNGNRTVFNNNNDYLANFFYDI